MFYKTKCQSWFFIVGKLFRKTTTKYCHCKNDDDGYYHYYLLIYMSVGVEATPFYCSCNVDCQSLYLWHQQVLKSEELQGWTEGGFPHLWIWIRIWLGPARHRLWLPRVHLFTCPVVTSTLLQPPLVTPTAVMFQTSAQVIHCRRKINCNV